jgi:hypothetical protein
MSKYVFDNRAVGAAFGVLAVVNAYLIMHGYYA